MYSHVQNLNNSIHEREKKKVFLHKLYQYFEIFLVMLFFEPEIGLID
jgi:hypothetical protein